MGTFNASQNLRRTRAQIRAFLIEKKRILFIYASSFAGSSLRMVQNRTGSPQVSWFRNIFIKVVSKTSLLLLNPFHTFIIIRSVTKVYSPA